MLEYVNITYNALVNTSTGGSANDFFAGGGIYNTVRHRPKHARTLPVFGVCVACLCGLRMVVSTLANLLTTPCDENRSSIFPRGGRFSLRFHLFAQGRGFMFQTLVEGNVAPPTGNGPAMYNGGNLTYILPAPQGEDASGGPQLGALAHVASYAHVQSFAPSTPRALSALDLTGRYLIGVFKCATLECYAPTSNTYPCPVQQCDESLRGDILSKVFQGSSDSDFPPRCPAGMNASSVAEPLWQQSSALCSGPCGAGHFCPTEATTSPVLAPPGYYAITGSINPTPCGATSFYCPGGGSGPVNVRTGFISTGGTADGLTRSGEAPCTPGHWCNMGESYSCSPGTYIDPTLPVSTRSSRLACVDCPDQSTSRWPAQSSITACECKPGYFHDPFRTADLYCFLCYNVSTICPNLGTTLFSLQTSKGYWRSSSFVPHAKPCPCKCSLRGGGRWWRRREERRPWGRMIAGPRLALHFNSPLAWQSLAFALVVSVPSPCTFPGTILAAQLIAAWAVPIARSA